MPSKLPNHPFVAAAMDRTRPLLLEAVDHIRANQTREEEAQAENRARMDAAGRYDSQVLRRTLGLMSTVRMLEETQRMIKVFPSQIAKGRSGVSRDRWVDYHYGYFTVSLASLPDIGTVLAATVVQTGLAPKHCTADVVMSHDSIKGTSVASALKGLSRVVTRAKERRNLHVHRAEHADIADVTTDRFLRDLKSLTFVASVTPGFADPALLRSLWRDATRTIVAGLDEEVTQAEDAMAVLLDALLPVFTERSDALRMRRLRRRLPNSGLQPTAAGG